MPDLKAPPELRSELNRIASVVHRKSGTTLFRRGEPGSGVFLIRKGKVNLHLDGKTQLYPSRTLGKGTILGLPATLSGDAYSLAAEVTEDAELGFVSREDFLALLAEHSTLCLIAMHLMGEEITRIRTALVSCKAKKAV